MLAFHIFPHVNIKAHTGHYYLCLLRFAIFHQLNDSQITGKIFLKAYTQLFQEILKSQPPSLSHKIYICFLNFWYGTHVIKKPYTTSQDKNTTRVECGTGKYFFDALSKGELKGYQLNAGTSPGIYVTPWPENTDEPRRLSRTESYAFRYSNFFFDEPIRVVMDVPNQYLGRIWIQHLIDANRYELTITEEKLEQMRQSGKVHVRVYPYETFQVEYDWSPINHNINNLEKELAITPFQKQILVEFLTQKLNTKLESQNSQPCELTFGQSLYKN